MGVLAQDPVCSLTLSGYVLDAHDGTPLAYASIQIKETGQGTIGDSTGFYRLTGLCPGEYTVVCTHVGCKPVELKILIRNHTSRNFYPEHHEEELKAVEVKSARGEKTTATVEHMEETTVMANAGKTFADAISTMTGVNLLQTGPTIAKPVIHGLHSSRLLIINNGVRQEDQQWGTEHAPEVDLLTAESVKVIKGAGGLRYGSDGIGGVILSEPPALKHDRLSGDLHTAFMSNNCGTLLAGRVQGGIPKWKSVGWRIQGSVKIAGDSKAPEYNLSNTGLREYGVSVATGFSRKQYQTELYYSFLLKQLAILRASHIGNLTDLQNALGSSRPWYVDDFTFRIQNPWQASAHHLLTWKAHSKLTEKWKLFSQLGFQFNHRREFDIRRGGKSDIPVINLHLQTYTIDLAVEHHQGQWHITAGAAAMYQNNHNVPGTGVFPLIPDYNLASAGAFVISRYVTNKAEAEAGIRYDFKHFLAKRFNTSNTLTESVRVFHNMAAVLGGLFRLPYHMSLRVNTGISERPPAIHELYSQGLHHGAAAIEEGDETLKTERAFKIGASLEYQLRNRIETSIYGYYYYFLGYIYLAPQEELRLTIRGAFPVFQYAQTRASLGGIDFYAKAETFRNLYFRSKFTLLRGRDISAGGYLYGLPADRFENRISYERAKWGRLEKVSFSLGVIHVLKQKRVLEGADFAPPPDSYWLLGAAVGATLPLQKYKSISFLLEGDNLLNKTYRDYMNRFRYYADEPGVNVSLRIHLKF
ncbi:MAG: membrane protein [Chitinophagales bacterium]|nr:MAG: membrane protein [Chitinophagales bacterium]